MLTSELQAGDCMVWDPFDTSLNASDDGYPTPTSCAQKQCEDEVRAAYWRSLTGKSGDEKLIPKLNRKAHAKALLLGLENFPQKVPKKLQSSQTWYLYWILHSLNLLQVPLQKAQCRWLMDHLQKCQHPNGGFGGGPNQDAHVCSTYAALGALVYLGEKPPWLNLTGLKHFLMSIKRRDGSFQATLYPSESDVRCCYCALASAKIAGIADEELQAGCVEYLRGLQTYEGGIAGGNGDEAHAGYTYCALAASKLLSHCKDNCFNKERLIGWLQERQCKAEGGFNGRTNKLVDSCYSFWVGASFKMLEDIDDSRQLYNRVSLVYFLLLACQQVSGGFRDRPGSSVDYYHSCYTLSALALINGTFQRGRGIEDGIESNDCKVNHTGQESNHLNYLTKELMGLARIDPSLNICVKKLSEWNK